ncbi:Seipin-2 [Sesamum angolense]|uniref:Seipin-2 n=1 Tax=Sesamum angolense TaxID=2727404 RepID=A0AAE2BIE3_9LAMI|nr:Seipin-2 [Sesamum angolense]
MEDKKSSTGNDDEEEFHDALDDVSVYDCVETLSQIIQSSADVSISAGNHNPLTGDKALRRAGLRCRRSHSHHKSSSADSVELSKLSSFVSLENCFNSRERKRRLSRKIEEHEDKLENLGSLEITKTLESPRGVLGEGNDEKNEEHSTLTDAKDNLHDDLSKLERKPSQKFKSYMDFSWFSDKVHQLPNLFVCQNFYDSHMCGWGLLWSAYVCAVLVGLLVSAFVMAGILIRVLVEEPVRMRRSLNFDYREKSPTAFVPMITYSELSHDIYLWENPEIMKASVSRVIPPNQKLKVTVSLTLPESEYNQHLGIFQVRVDFLAADGKTIASSRRPCMLQFRSQPVRHLLTLLKIVPIITGYTSETQHLKISFRGFSEGEKPTACLRVVIEQRAEYLPGGGIPEIYAASLTLDSELPLLRKAFWSWRKTLFVWIGMAIFAIELVFALLCCKPIIIPKVRMREAANADASENNRTEMVSKIVKRTPTKSLKNRKNLPHHHRRRSHKKSPIKNASSAASVVVASINKSIYTCHRRLIKIFTKLARIATPNKTPRKKGYQILDKVPVNSPDITVRKSLFNESITLPPLLSPDKKTIFLDLDETLVHSTATIPPERYDFVVRPVINGEKVEFFVLKRPFVDEFLNFLSKKFEIVVFTAGIEEYASLVLDRLDWRRLISHRLYRDSCKEVDGRFVKDLSGIGRELNRVVIVDDNPNSYQFQPDNAIPIKPFTDDLGDEELKGLIQFFEGCEEVEDTRNAVKAYLTDPEAGTVEEI